MQKMIQIEHITRMTLYIFSQESARQVNDEANRLMSNTLISAQDIEECIACPPLRSHTERISDEDEHDETVAERGTEDKEAARKMNKLSSTRGDNDDTLLDDMFIDRNMEDEEHATDEEAVETEPTEFEEPVEDEMPFNEE